MFEGKNRECLNGLKFVSGGSYTTKAIFQAKKQSIANAQMSLVKLYLPKKERKQIMKNNLR